MAFVAPVEFVTPPYEHECGLTCIDVGLRYRPILMDDAWLITCSDPDASCSVVNYADRIAWVPHTEPNSHLCGWITIPADVYTDWVLEQQGKYDAYLDTQCSELYCSNTFLHPEFPLMASMAVAVGSLIMWIALIDAYTYGTTRDFTETIIYALWHWVTGA